MLKVVESFKMRGREFSRHRVDQLALRIRIVRIHLSKTCRPQSAGREGGGWSRVQTRRCPARHCTKIFTLPANKTCSACSNSNEQLSIDLPGMKIKNTTQRNSWKGQPYLTIVNTGSSVLFSSRPNIPKVKTAVLTNLSIFGENSSHKASVCLRAGGLKRYSI